MKVEKSGPCSDLGSGSSTQRPGQKLDENGNNSKRRVILESGTPGKSTDTQKGARYRIGLHNESECLGS